MSKEKFNKIPRQLTSIKDDFLIAESSEYLCNNVKFNLGSVLEGQAELSGTIIYPIANFTRNPHIDAANEQSINWAIRLGLIDSHDAFEKLQRAKFTAVFPTALRIKCLDDLKLLGDFVTFLFLFDDIIDQHWLSVREQLPNLESVFKVFIDIIQGDYTDIAAIPHIDFYCYKNFSAALFDICDRFRTKQASHAYFIKCMHGYFGSIIWELTDRLSNDALTETTYLSMRGHTGAVRASFELIALICEIEVPEAIRNNPVFERVVSAANIALCIMNDIVSFPKELFEPSHSNLIWVKLDELVNACPKIKLKKGKLLQQAINYAIKRHNAEVYDFIQWQKLLPMENHALNEYCAILLACLWDNLNWSFTETDRYLNKMRSENLKYKEIMAELPRQYKNLDLFLGNESSM